MQVWYVLFVDEPEKEALHDQWDGWPGRLGRYYQATQSGMLDGRRVLGMWILDQRTAKGEIVELFGSVPSSIAARHAVQKAAVKRRLDRLPASFRSITEAKAKSLP